MISAICLRSMAQRVCGLQHESTVTRDKLLLSAFDAANNFSRRYFTVRQNIESVTPLISVPCDESLRRRSRSGACRTSQKSGLATFRHFRSRMRGADRRRIFRRRSDEPTSIFVEMPRSLSFFVDDNVRKLMSLDDPAFSVLQQSIRSASTYRAIAFFARCNRISEPTCKQPRKTANNGNTPMRRNRCINYAACAAAAATAAAARRPRIVRASRANFDLDT
jgi:hypothetical protein